jgi:hypothetical protein
VQNSCAEGARFDADGSDSFGVDRESEGRFRFGFVYGSLGRGVDDPVRTNAADPGPMDAASERFSSSRADEIILPTGASV